jgi:hypothetical protein
MPRSTDDVIAAIIGGDESNAGHIKKSVEEAMDDLEKKEIIRKRLDPDTRQHVWILDHDYLCRGVVEAERRANHWFALARESYKTFQDAGGSFWRKWWSLLSPWSKLGWQFSESVGDSDTELCVPTRYGVCFGSFPTSLFLW